jgi:hypothetical protein
MPVEQAGTFNELLATLTADEVTALQAAPIPFEWSVGAPRTAEEYAARLTSAGAQLELHSALGKSIPPPVVVAGVAASAHLLQAIFTWWDDLHRPGLIVAVADGKVTVRRELEVHGGQALIVFPDGSTIEYRQLSLPSLPTLAAALQKMLSPAAAAA